MFTYGVYDSEGNELGDAAYAQRIKPACRVFVVSARGLPKRPAMA